MTSPDEDIVERQVNAIVGAAIRALVESGADDTFIAQFALSHRIKVASILEHREPTAPPRLEDIISATIDEIVKRGLVPSAPRKEKAQRINVLINGVRTSVTVPGTLMEALVSNAGTLKEARQMIKLAATDLDAHVETNQRSSVLRTQLERQLASIKQAAAPRSTTRH